MKLINVYFLIFTFLYAPFSIRAGEEQRKADSLYRTGAFYEASVEYERCYYFADSPVLRCQAILGKANCLKQLGEYGKAAARLAQAPLQGLEDTLAFQLQYQMAFCQYLAADFQTANGLLADLRLRYVQPELLVQTEFLQFLLWNELRQYDSAELTAVRYVKLRYTDPFHANGILRILEQHYDQQNLPHLKNANSAVWMSRIVPGLGQTWLGHPGEGAVNFVLNAASLGLGIFGVVSGYPITGYFLGTGFLQKFYFGGINRTKYLSQKVNYQRAKRFNDKSRAMILNL